MSIAAPLLAVFISIAYLILSKLFVGKNKRKVSETTGKNIQLWGLVIIGLVSIYCIFALDILDNNVMKWFWLSFIIIALGFQSFLEWKFLKEIKQYVVSLFVLMLGLIYIIIFMF